MTALPPVARNIYVFCKKCDTDRYFKVITHTSSTSAKLKCEVCGGSKTFNLGDEKSSVNAEKKPTKPRVAGSKTTSSSMWASLKEQYKGPAAVDYTVKHKFKGNESLQHPTFGLGFVTKAHPHKIEVLFSEGLKELLHGRI